jgi:hypothetical protein
LRHPHFGEEMGKICTSRGKNGEDFQYQSANSQTGIETVIPDNLRTQKYSIFLLIFNSIWASVENKTTLKMIDL